MKNAQTSLAALGLIMSLASGSGGCFRCGIDPPGFGTVIVAVRTPPAADLAGITSLRMAVDRVDIVHRTIEDDPSTEEVRTVLTGPQTFEIIGLVAGAPRIVTTLLVETGFVLQVRFVMTELTATIDGEEIPIFVPSGAQTGIKLVPRGDPLAPWEVVDGGVTALRAEYDPGELIVSSPGRGLIERPTIETSQVDPSEVLPVVPGRIIVRFEDTANEADVQALLVARGATVAAVIPSRRHHTLELALTDTIDNAVAFYAGSPAVRYAGPVTVFDWQMHPDPGDLLDPDQWPLVGLMAAGIPPAKDAWDPTIGGTEGDPAVTIAIVDSGVDLDHPDLVYNLFFNSGELPNPDFRVGGENTLDFNGDGVITFAELNSDIPGEAALVAAAGISDDLPNPVNPNIGLVGIIDGFDVLCALTNGNDEDGNGLDDDLVGWNFTANDPSPQLRFVSADCFLLGLDENCPDDGDGHGTAVAGAAGAVTNNTNNGFIGIAGLARNVRLLPLKVGGPLGTHMTPVMLAMTFVLEDADVDTSTPTNEPPDIVNMSFASMIVTSDVALDPGCLEALPVNVIPADNPDKYTFLRATALAEWLEFRSVEVLVTKTAGNCPADVTLEEVFMPGVEVLLENFVTVTSSNDSDAVPGGFGPFIVDLAAPGIDYPVLILGGDVPSDPSLSLGSAFAAGAAALTVSANPELRYMVAEIATRLIANADIVPGLVSFTSAGFRLNVCQSVTGDVPCQH